MIIYIYIENYDNLNGTMIIYIFIEKNKKISYSQSARRQIDCTKLNIDMGFSFRL